MDGIGGTSDKFRSKRRLSDGYGFWDYQQNPSGKEKGLSDNWAFQN